jgi:hypothetical protein
MMTVVVDSDRYVKDVVELLGEDIHFWLGPIEIGGETCIADLPSIVYASGEFNFTGHKDLREEVRVGRSAERQRALVDRVKNLLNDDSVLNDDSNHVLVSTELSTVASTVECTVSTLASTVECTVSTLASTELAPVSTLASTILAPVSTLPSTELDSSAIDSTESSPMVSEISNMVSPEIQGKRKIYTRTLFNAPPQVKRSR